MPRCSSFIYCIAITCHAFFIAVGLLSIGGTCAAYYFLLGSSRAEYGLAIMDFTWIYLFIPMVFFLLIGLILVALGIFGIVKARKIEEKPKIMLIVALAVIVITVIIAVLIFMSLLYVEDVEARLDSKMSASIEIAVSDPDSSERKEWDNVQSSFQCCGVTDGWDWQEAHNSVIWTDEFVPESCGSSEAEKQSREGCKDTIQDDILFITLVACGILALAGGVTFIACIMMVAVAIKSMRDPEWMRLNNQVIELDDDDDDISTGEAKSVHDNIKGMEMSRPVSARDVQIANRKAMEMGLENKKAIPVVIS